MGLTPQTLPALVLARAAGRGGNAILRRKDHGIWKPVSWLDLGAAVESVGAALLADGVAPGQVVGLLSETRPEWAYADLAAMGAGAVSAGLPTSGPAGQLAEALAACACSLLFVENEEMLDKVLSVQAGCPALRRVVVFDMGGLRDLDPAVAESFGAFIARGGGFVPAWVARAGALDPDSPAALIYTAGTTGPPRPVVLSHRTLMAQAAAGAAMLGQSEGDERLAFLPMSHVLERVVGLYQSLVSGTVTNYAEGADTVADNLRELQPTVIGAVPRVWDRLRTRIALAAAEASPVQRRAYEWGMHTGERVEAHAGGRPGPRDAGEGRLPPALRAQRRLAEALVLGPVRRRLGLDRARVAFASMAPMPPDLLSWYRALGVDMREGYALTECAGLASLSPPHVASGPGLSLSPDSEVMVRCAQPVGWLRTGDVGAKVGAGWVILGRMTDVVTAPDGGVLVPGVVETALRASPFIADAVVWGNGALLAGLVLPEAERVERWAMEHGLSFATYAALLRADPVRDLMQREVAAVNARLPPAHRVHGFSLIERRLQPGDAEMTAAMTLRRALLRGEAGLHGAAVRCAA